MSKRSKDQEKYLLLDLHTGAMDGFYIGETGMKREKVEAIKQMDDRYYGTNWVVVKIIEDANKDLTLPDSTWHCTCKMLDGRRKY